MSSSGAGDEVEPAAGPEGVLRAAVKAFETDIP